MRGLSRNLFTLVCSGLGTLLWLHAVLRGLLQSVWLGIHIRVNPIHKPASFPSVISTCGLCVCTEAALCEMEAGAVLLLDYISLERETAMEEVRTSAHLA